MKQSSGARTGGRRGVSLVEVLISVAVLGLAMAPIIGIVHRSFSQIRMEKDEATAANMAGQILNQILSEAKYADVIGNSFTSSGPPPMAIMPAGNTTVDGCQVDWKTTVLPMNNLRFIYRQFTYHPGEAGGETRNISGFNFPDFKRVTSLDVQGPLDDRQFNNPAIKIDQKFAGTQAVMVEVHLELRWRAPGGTYGPYENLYVRRAKLD